MPACTKNVPPRHVTTPWLLDSQPMAEAVPKAPVYALVATLYEQSYFLAGPVPDERVSTRGRTSHAEPHVADVLTERAAEVEADRPLVPLAPQATSASEDTRIKVFFGNLGIPRFFQLKAPTS